MMGSNGYVGGASCGGANNAWGRVCFPGCLRKNGICCSVTKCHLRKREPKKKKKKAHMGNLHARENRCIHPKTGPDVKGDSFALQQSHRNEEWNSTQTSSLMGERNPRARREVTIQNEPFVLLKVCNLLSSLTEDTANFVLLLNYNTHKLWRIIISWGSATAAAPSCG